MNSTKTFILALLLALIGCATNIPPPQWNQVTDQTESEYKPYLIDGNANLSGQAFLTQQSGGVIKAAGREVTLDPATSVGIEWWNKAGKLYVFRQLTPPSTSFLKARRTVLADAEGRFKFSNIPAGTYYVRTEVTWEVGGYNPTQGGLVGHVVEVKNNQNTEVILNSFAQ